MSYQSAVYYLDYSLGSDTARADLVPSAYANNGAGLVRVTVGGIGATVTDAVVTIAGTTWSIYVGSWKITAVDATHIDLQGSTYTSNPAAKGTCIPNGGCSWADAWKTITSGATAARIAPGDIVRIAKSPAPASIGNGTWTDNTRANGGFPWTVAITSSTNASPVVVTKVAHGFVNGDIIQVVGHTTNTEANGIWKVANKTANTLELEGSTGNGIGGATGTMQLVTSKVVQLATAQTKMIAQCKTAWTAIAGGDATPSLLTTDSKEGGACSKILMDAATQASVGQAYFTLPLNTDFSAYQRISFWIKNSAAVADANTWVIKLCSDTLGAVGVDTFVIPAIPSTNQWMPLTITKSGGGNLMSLANSIAVYTGTTAPTNSCNILIDNIVACTTSGMNMQSLLSTNTLEQGGAEGWYGIQSISQNGTLVAIDSDVNCRANEGRGYSGSTQTAVTTYARETIKTAMVATANLAVQIVSKAGTAVGGNIQFQGGYNTSNSAQDGETFFDGLNGFGIGVIWNKALITSNRINAYRYNIGIYSISNVGYIQNIQGCCNNTISGLDFGRNVYGGGGVARSWKLDNVYNVNNNGSFGISYGPGTTNNPTAFRNIIGNVSNANNNGNAGINFAYGGLLNKILSVASASNNAFYGVVSSLLVGNEVSNINTKANGGAGITAEPAGEIYVKNWVPSESSPVGGFNDYSGVRVCSANHGGGTDHRIYTDGGQIDSAATDRGGGTGKMWKLTITSANRSSAYPLTMSLMRVAVNANKAVTITAWAKKDNAITVGGKIVVRGGQLAGVASDVTVDFSSADTSWHQLTLPDFTPTELGVIEVEVWAYYVAGTSNVYVGEVTITQAA